MPSNQKDKITISLLKRNTNTVFCMCCQDAVHTAPSPSHCWQPCTSMVFASPVKLLLYPHRYVALPPLPCIINTTENRSRWILVHLGRFYTNYILNTSITNKNGLFLPRCILSPFMRNYVQWEALNTPLIHSFKCFYECIKIMACPGHSFNKLCAFPACQLD